MAVPLVLPVVLEEEMAGPEEDVLEQQAKVILVVPVGLMLAEVAVVLAQAEVLRRAILAVLVALERPVLSPVLL
jgi:hypothetical protein